MLRCSTLVCLIALPWTAGCASGVPPLPEGIRGTAELTVRVWSVAEQAAVPGRGVVREVGGEGRASFDTSGQEGVSQTLAGLRPGLYEVRVEERWDGARVRRATGSVQVYLEPGQPVLAIPVAVDRPTDTGRAPERGHLWSPDRPQLPPGLREVVGAPTTHLAARVGRPRVR